MPKITIPWPELVEYIRAEDNGITAVSLTLAQHDRFLCRFSGPKDESASLSDLFWAVSDRRPPSCAFPLQALILSAPLLLNPGGVLWIEPSIVLVPPSPIG